MQERVSQLPQFKPGEIGPVFEPGTLVFINDAAMGIIKVVSGSGSPSQVEDRIETRAGSRPQKICQVSLLTWELKHRAQGSSGRGDKGRLSSTE
jgi:hypothetical protein